MRKNRQQAVDMAETERISKTESFKEIMGRLYMSSGGASLRGRRAKMSAEYRRQLVMAHWSEIVSPTVSAHAVPHHFSFDTLFISAQAVWANQLVYLKRELIDRINAYTCGETVKDIRFTAWEDINQPVIKKEQPEKSPAASEDEIICSEVDRDEAKQAVDRLMGTADRNLKYRAEKSLAIDITSRKRKMKDGFIKCLGGCGTLVPPEEGYCSACIVVKHDEYRQRIRSKLIACPWAGYAEVNSFVKCRPEEYNRVRQELLREQAAKVPYRKDTDTPGTYTLEEYVLVMLYKSLPLERLNNVVMSKYLYELRYDLKGGPYPTSKKKRLPFKGAVTEGD